MVRQWVGGSQQEYCLGKGKAGSQQHKFRVGVLQGGEKLRDVMDCLDLLLNHVMDKSLYYFDHLIMEGKLAVQPSVQGLSMEPENNNSLTVLSKGKGILVNLEL